MRHDDYWYVELEWKAGEQYFELEEAVDEDEFARTGVFRVSCCLPLEQRPVSMVPDAICSQAQHIPGDLDCRWDYEKLSYVESDVEEFQFDCRGQIEQIWG